MISILNEISKLRNGIPIAIDYTNTNRYRLVINESDESKTAYYFNTPIYNNKTHKNVDMKFHVQDGTIYSIGSNTNTVISDKIRMDNAEGFSIISLESHAQLISDYEIKCGNERLYPTTNGIAIKSSCQGDRIYNFVIEVSNPSLTVRANDKCFALMSDKFRPFFSVSCIGTTDIDGYIIAPAIISYQQITNRKYAISVSPCSSVGQAVFIEANFYEPKLFQDTTVESNNPTINNAFGGIGFIGTTPEFGEQWLYAKSDFSKMSELNGRIILNATLHIPKLSNDSVALSVSQVATRFCSFGSNWNNKKPETVMIAESQYTDNYIDLDLTALFSNNHGRLINSDGFIIKSKDKWKGFSVIATSDNYFTPQILEIKYI